MVFFQDRLEAGRALGAALRKRGLARSDGDRGPLVLGIPRGGVPVAAEVARALEGDLGVVVARKLRAPSQPEFAIGAVAADGSVYLDEGLAMQTGADDSYLAEEIRRQSDEARLHEKAFDGHHRAPIRGRTVVVVDDGVATGATAIAALRSLKAGGARQVILAVPVGPPDTVAALEREADEVVCLSAEPDFSAVGQFYRNFNAVPDREVRAVLDAFVRPAESAEHAGFITRDGIQLAVRVLRPAATPPHPCVVFVHGLGSSKESPRNVTIAEHLRDAGFAVVLFDLNGHGDSAADPRGRAAYAADLLAVLGWSTALPGIDAARVGIAGSSLGVNVALEALQQGAIEPAALVLRAPPVEAGDLDRLSAPTLAIIGSHDPLLAGVLAAAKRSRFVEVRVVAGASHLFDEPGTLDEALAHTLDWFVTHMSTGMQSRREPASGLSAGP